MPQFCAQCAVGNEELAVWCLSRWALSQSVTHHDPGFVVPVFTDSPIQGEIELTETTAKLGSQLLLQVTFERPVDVHICQPQAGMVVKPGQGAS